MRNTRKLGEHFTIQQAQDSYVPGMYAINPVSGVERFTDLSDDEVRLLASYQRKLRIGLKSLDIALCGLYVEEYTEQPVTSITLPLHIGRLASRFDVEVYQPHIESYIKSYNAHDLQDVIKYDNATERCFEDQTRGYDAIPYQPSGDKKHDQEWHETTIDEILEIDDELELPMAPVGKKYYVCIGGAKNFQAFLCDDTMSKGEFLDKFTNEIDDVLAPVYEDEDLVVRQDAKYAIPGFYIVSPKKHYRSIDKMPQEYFDHCMIIAKRVKENVAELGVETSHIYHDEKYLKPASVHFWILPLPRNPELTSQLSIYSKDIWTYLDTYPRFSETYKQIRDYNDHMRQAMNQYRHA